MPSIRVNKSENVGTYFLTFTVLRWYFIFDRYDRWNILADSLKYFQKNKNLKLICFVFMLNHIHLIIHSENVIEFIRDFKKYTSKRLKENLSQTEPHILKLFSGRDSSYRFWQKTNMPVELTSETFFSEKYIYIENNPVVKNYVKSPEDWYWSSANEDCELQVDDF